jgi:hypothetical protein
MGRARATAPSAAAARIGNGGGSGAARGHQRRSSSSSPQYRLRLLLLGAMKGRVKAPRLAETDGASGWWRRRNVDDIRDQSNPRARADGRRVGR